MKLILLTDVEKLGKAGDAVTVKDGYGRNFLIPRKLATPFTEKASKILEARKKKEESRRQKLKSEAEKLAAQITTLSLTITMESGVDDKLFGAVTPEKIAGALHNEGVHIDKKDILIEEPVKKLGVYQVGVRLHPEVQAALRIWVVKK